MPVPSALETASFAAKRLAKKSAGSAVLVQSSNSVGVKILCASFGVLSQALRIRAICKISVPIPTIILLKHHVMAVLLPEFVTSAVSSLIQPLSIQQTMHGQ